MDGLRLAQGRRGRRPHQTPAPSDRGSHGRVAVLRRSRRNRAMAAPSGTRDASAASTRRHPQASRSTTRRRTPPIDPPVESRPFECIAIGCDEHIDLAAARHVQHVERSTAGDGSSDIYRRHVQVVAIERVQQRVDGIRRDHGNEIDVTGRSGDAPPGGGSRADDDVLRLDGLQRSHNRSEGRSQIDHGSTRASLGHAARMRSSP